MPIEATVDTIIKANDELVAKAKECLETCQQEGANSITALSDFGDRTLHANLQLSERLADYSRSRTETSFRLGQRWLQGKFLPVNGDSSPTEEAKEGLNKLMEADRSLYNDLAQWWKAGQDRQMSLTRELVEAQFRALKAGQMFFDALSQYGKTMLGTWQESASEFVEDGFDGQAIFSTKVRA